MVEGPPEMVECGCGYAMLRDWQADVPMIDTSSCRDHDFIPEEKRVASNDGMGVGKRGAEKRVRGFKKHIDERRKALADGGNKGNIRHTNSVPADLFHGKIRETGDKNYWNDPSNMAKHKSTKVN
tara:strand:- start:1480 stop:1854 length:375 start_codon:yes stop_codon:yes gene_type:complete